MSFLTKRLYQRFPKVGFLADMVLVGTAVTKVVQRRGSGSNSIGVSQSLSVTEMMLAGGAAMRLASRLFRRSK